MSFAPGARLGPYEIGSLVGAGGMGEVYKAKDTRLGRTVAIKVLPPQLATDPQFRDRFDREARTISQLDHPHICALYDVGEQDGTAYLVMQYLDGETLADRLVKGALPLDQALTIATQIAEALDRAHRAGIIHRDLKPGNIFLTRSGARLLDFGLAKARAPLMAGAGNGSVLPTTPSYLTVHSTILGTLQYMAPEQLEGADADARTDLFAFGAVVYEMLTGKKAFEGTSQATLIAAIVSGQPTPMSTLQPLTPPALEHVVATCLAKQPDNRFDSAHDLLLQLRWIVTAGSQPAVPAPIVRRSSIRERLVWTLTAASISVALSLAVIVVDRSPKKEATTRFVIDVPANADPNTTFKSANVAVSPDGRRLAFIGNMSDARGGLWVRLLNSVAAQSLPGTEDAYLPFWSPDSRSLAFFADGKLKRIDASGGPPQTLCDVTVGYGGTWNREGAILFAGQWGGGIDRVPDSGGVPTSVTMPDPSRRETGHVFPSFLPGGHHFLYLTLTSHAEGRAIHIGALDSKKTKPLVHVNSNATYAPPGYLLFVREGTLVAQSFDATRLTLTGDPVSVAERVGVSAESGLAFVSASDTGVLAYQGGVSMDTQLVWFDRKGRTLGALGDPADYSNPALSPDGTKVAVGRRDLQVQTRDIWVFDLKRGTASRFTFDPADDVNPVWSSDGRQIFLTSDRNGHRDIYQKAASGASTEEVVLESNSEKSIDDVSADGRYVLYDTGGTSAGMTTVWVWPRFGAAKPFPFLPGTTFESRHARLSPDGRWIAYSSNESGSFEVYVQTFPERRGKWQISTTGGTEPTWRRDGKELFYLGGDKIMAVAVRASSDQFEAGTPSVLFEAHPINVVARSRYAVTADGQRFLINISADAGKKTSSPLTVVVNWPAELKK